MPGEGLFYLGVLGVAGFNVCRSHIPLVTLWATRNETLVWNNPQMQLSANCGLSL